MENLTYEEMVDLLKKMTSHELLEALDLESTEPLIEALEDHIMDSQEAIIENLFEMGVV